MFPTILSCILTYILYIFYSITKPKAKKNTKYKRKRSGFPGQPFSVLLSDATFGNAITILSAIHIACKFCGRTMYKDLRHMQNKFTIAILHFLVHYSPKSKLYSSIHLFPLLHIISLQYRKICCSL